MLFADRLLLRDIAVSMMPLRRHYFVGFRYTLDY